MISNTFQLNFTSSFRRISGNFRQIISLTNIEICVILNNIYKFPQLVDELIAANSSMFPGMIHKCPYKSIKVFNASMTRIDDENLAPNAPNRQLFPNGVYKNTLAFFDDLDECIGEITYFFEIYIYMNKFDLK